MEEIICSAASIIVIRILFPNEFIEWNNYAKNLEANCYNEGAAYAELIAYSLEELKNKISNFKYE